MYFEKFILWLITRCRELICTVIKIKKHNMAASYQNDDQARKTNFSTTIFGEKLLFSLPQKYWFWEMDIDICM